MSSEAWTEPGRDQPGQVDRGALADVEPVRLVRGVQRRHDEAGGDDDEHEPRGPEELGEVEPDSPAVDAVAEPAGDRDAEDRAEPRLTGVAAAVEGGEQEHRRLEALPEDGQEGHGDECVPRARFERRVGGTLELLLEVAGVPAHPDDHVGHHRHRDRTDDRLEPLLLLLGQVGRQHVQADSHAQADESGDTDAEPDQAQQIAAPALVEERGDDADDESRFEALTQPDDERWQHHGP